MSYKNGVYIPDIVDNKVINWKLILGVKIAIATNTTNT